jgi:hypothetical protein
MQTLGLSESTPRTENRLKSLFWPDIKTGSDVDYIGAQGYWVCALVAFVSFAFTVLISPFIATLTLFLYYLGGVGVRERSRYAAVVVFALFVLDVVASPFSVLKILMTVLLLSNVRATWIAYHWRADSEDASLPPRFNDTWSDKFADTFPGWLWPKIRYPYYVFSAGLFGLVMIGALVKLAR